MIVIQGEVRKVIVEPYKDKSGKEIPQAILILEPSGERQNYEVYLNENQLRSGAAEAWNKLRGKVANIGVTLYVNYQYNFHRFNASGKGLPVEMGAANG